MTTSGEGMASEEETRKWPSPETTIGQFVGSLTGGNWETGRVPGLIHADYTWDSQVVQESPRLGGFDHSPKEIDPPPATH